MPDNSPRRRTTRLREYDYRSPGAYFVTICTAGRACLFGEVREGVMVLSDYGHIAREEWIHTVLVRPAVRLDAFVVMPNHVHGILLIVHEPVGTRRAVSPPQAEAFGRPVAGSLSTIVRSYKSAVTRRINDLRSTPGLAVWQGRFYEHIVRNEAEMARIREYIHTNPARWAEDRENPNNIA